MRLPGLLAVTLLVLLPSVSAGSEQDPEITDGRDQREPWKDILAIWFEDDPEGVRFTIKVAALSAPRPSVLYTVSWSGRDTDVAIGFDSTRALRSSVNTPNGWGGGEGSGPARVDDALRGETFVPGSPAYLSAIIPSSLFGFEDGDVLRGLSSTTVFFDESRGEWVLDADAATTTKTFRVGGGGFFPILVPQWVIPTIVLACTASGAWAGLAIARRRKRAPAKVATSVPVQTTRAPPPPPGQRFQRAPPTGKT